MAPNVYVDDSCVEYRIRNFSELIAYVTNGLENKSNWISKRSLNASKNEYMVEG